MTMAPPVPAGHPDNGSAPTRGVRAELLEHGDRSGIRIHPTAGPKYHCWFPLPL